MISISQDDLGLHVSPQLFLCHRFYTANSANGHKNGRFYFAMGGSNFPGPGIAAIICSYQFKIHATVFQAAKIG